MGILTSRAKKRRERQERQEKGLGRKTLDGYKKPKIPQELLDAVARTTGSGHDLTRRNVNIKRTLVVKSEPKVKTFSLEDPNIRKPKRKKPKEVGDRIKKRTAIYIGPFKLWG